MHALKPQTEPNRLYESYNLNRIIEAVDVYNEYNNTNYYLAGVNWKDNQGANRVSMYSTHDKQNDIPLYAVQRNSDVEVYDDNKSLFVVYGVIPSVRRCEDFADCEYAKRVLEIFNSIKNCHCEYKLVRKLDYNPDKESYMYRSLYNHSYDEYDTDVHVYCKDISDKCLQFYTAENNKLIFSLKYSLDTYRNTDNNFILNNIMIYDGDITDTNMFTDFEYAVRVLDAYNDIHYTEYKLIRKCNLESRTSTVTLGVVEQHASANDTSTHVYCKDISNDCLQFYSVYDDKLLFTSKYFKETWQYATYDVIKQHVASETSIDYNFKECTADNEPYVRFDGEDCARVKCAQKAREQFEWLSEQIDNRIKSEIKTARDSGKIYIEQPDIGYWKIHDTDGYYAGITTTDWEIVRDFLAEMDRGKSDVFLSSMQKFITDVMCNECNQSCQNCRIHDLIRAINRRLRYDYSDE